MEQFLKEAKKSTKIISTLSGNVKNQILNEMAEALIINSDKIIQENQKDIKDGRLNNLNFALMDRLLLNKTRTK